MYKKGKALPYGHEYQKSVRRINEFQNKLNHIQLSKSFLISFRLLNFYFKVILTVMWNLLDQNSYK